jgi:hypothetical protein
MEELNYHVMTAQHSPLCIPAEYANTLDNQKEVQCVTMKRDEDRKLLLSLDTCEPVTTSTGSSAMIAGPSNPQLQVTFHHNRFIYTELL